MVQARIFVVGLDRKRDQVYIEAAHPALIKNWDRCQDWLDNLGEKMVELHISMRQAVAIGGKEKQWSFDPDLDLLRGEGDRKDGQLNKQEREFLHECFHLRRRRKRFIYSGLVGAIVVLAGLMVVALVERGKAVKAEKEAIEQTEIALERKKQLLVNGLTHQSEAALKNGDLSTALRLAEFGCRFVFPKNKKLVYSLMHSWYYAVALRNQWAWKLNSFPAGNREIRSLILSGDGSTIAAICFNHDIIIWNAKTGSVVQEIRGDQDYWEIALSKDGSKLVTSSTSTAGEAGLQLWKVGPMGTPQPLGSSADKIVYSSDGKHIAEISLLGWIPAIQILRLDEQGATSIISEIGRRVAFSPNGKYCAIEKGTLDSPQLTIFDLETENHYSLPGGIDSLRFGPDDKRFIYVVQGELHLFNIQSGKLMRRTKIATDLAFKHSSFLLTQNHVVAISGNGFLYEWNIESGMWTKGAKAGYFEEFLKYSFDRQVIWVKTKEGKVEARHLDPNGEPLSQVVPISSTNDRFHIPESGHQLISISKSRKTIDRYSTYEALGKVRCVLGDLGSGLHLPLDSKDGYVAYTPYGDSLITGVGSVGMYISSINTGLKNIAFERREANAIINAVFSPTGDTVLVRARNGSCELYEFHSRRFLKSVKTSFLPPTYSAPIAYSPSGNSIAFANKDKIIVYFPNSEIQYTLPIPSGYDQLNDSWLIQRNYVRDIAYDSTGNIIYGIFLDGWLGMWNVREGEFLDSYGETKFRFGLWRGERGERMTVSGNGKLLAFKSSPHTITILDAKTLEHQYELNGLEGTDHAYIFSSDGRFLISVGQQDDTRFWEVDSEKELWSIPSRNQSLSQSISIAPDGRSFATVGGDLVINPSSPKEVLQRITDLGIAFLSPETIEELGLAQAMEEGVGFNHFILETTSRQLYFFGLYYQESAEETHQNAEEKALFEKAERCYEAAARKDSTYQSAYEQFKQKYK